MTGSQDLQSTRPPEETSAAALPMDAHEGAIGVVTPRAPSLVHGSLPAAIARLALPAVMSNLFMMLFLTADAVWVGRQIGPDGLAAVTTSSFWIWMVVSLGEMVSIGLTAVAARRHGEGNPAAAARAVGDALRLGLGLALMVGLIAIPLLDEIFASMQAPPAVSALGVQYLGPFLLGLPLIYGYFSVDAAFRASGDTRTPFVLLAASVAVTLALDPVLIAGWGPAPRLGIAGAAVATLLTRGLAFAVGLWILHRRRMVAWDGISWPTLATICRVGLPTAATGILFSVIYVAIARIATPFGVPALAALGVGHRVEAWMFMVGMGFGVAAAAIVGQNLGAGRHARASRAGWLSLLYASIPGAVGTLILLAFPDRIALAFSTDAEVIRESASYLRIIAFSQLFISAELVFEGALGGAGYTIAPMLASTTLNLVRIPLAAWAARWGPAGIWWVIGLTATARGIAMLLLWRGGRWRRSAV